MRIPGDTVNKATANLPDNQRSAIRRLHAHYIEHDLTLGETARLIGKSDAVVSLVFRGRYEAGLDAVVGEIEDFFELLDKRSQGRKLDFIETALTRRIWKVCDAAIEFQKIAIIIGDMQIGKTEALRAYQSTHNHGSTIYVSMPTGGALGNFLAALARKLRIGENLSVTRMRERIMAAFDDRMLLIVDECHRCVRETGRSSRSIDSIDYVREIFDEKQCGVVLCATNVFRDAMASGPLEKILRQTKRRRLCTMQLPNTPAQNDLNTFAAGYHLPPSSGSALDLEKRMVESEALGMWLTLLRMAAKVAAERKQKMTWNHVLTAYAGLQELEGKKF
jgi:DNA transposition AAA+ family ATPase